jgi:hypothetical protein
MTFRHQCEVRHLLKLRAKGERFMNDYLDMVQKKRGEELALTLRTDCSNQWFAGNRGKWGVWIDKT